MNPRRAGIAVLVVTVTALGAWLVLRGDGSSDGALYASGTIEATEADLGFQAGGRILTLAVREGERVAAGQELARLDAAELEARREAAQAQVEAAQALLAEMRTGARPEELRQARAAESAARERLEDAARLLERTRRLEEGGAVSREAADQARTAHEVARAQHEQAREQLALVSSGPRAERIAAQQAAVRQAESAVAQVDAALSHAVVRAPFDGIVTVRHRQPGEAVAPGAPVLTLMNPDDRWVRIYVRQDAVGRVALGQDARIRTDSDATQSYAGRVTFIGSQAEFTPRNVQTTEQRVRLVYAVKVAITDDPRLVLKPGVPADVTLVQQ